MGGLLNRFGVRITTVLACLSCSAGLAMGSFAPQVIVLYISFSLPFALGLSFIYISSPIIVTYYFTKRRSFALGIVTAGQGLGTMILGPTLQAVVDVLDWRNTFRVFAGILAVVSVTGCFLHQRKTSPDENPRGPSKKFRLNLSLLKNPIILVLVIRNSLCSFPRFVPYVHLVSIAYVVIYHVKGITKYSLLCFRPYRKWGFPEYIMSPRSLCAESYGACACVCFLLKRASPCFSS